MYPAYAKWIKSHRDLPLKLNQWNNVVVCRDTVLFYSFFLRVAVVLLAVATIIIIIYFDCASRTSGKCFLLFI